MFQFVLANHSFTKESIRASYIKKLNSIGDAVLNKQRFGINQKVDRLMFIKIKNLLPVLTADIVTIPFNNFYSVLNNN